MTKKSDDKILVSQQETSESLADSDSDVFLHNTGS